MFFWNITTPIIWIQNLLQITIKFHPIASLRNRHSLAGIRKTQVFKKKAQPTGFLRFPGFWALLGFRIFYLHEELGSLLVDLAHQLSFYLDCQYFRLTKNLQIRYLLVVRSCKHEEIFNYYWHDKLKLN